MSFFFILVTLLCTSLLNALPPSEPIHFKSDSLEYSQANQVLTASGSVTIHQGS